MKLLIHSKLQRLHHWSFGMGMWSHPILYNGCNYLTMLGLKLIHVSKRARAHPWRNYRAHMLRQKRRRSWRYLEATITWRLGDKGRQFLFHYSDVIMGTITSQTTSLTIVYSTVYSDADQRKHQSSASLAFVREFTVDRWIPHTNGQ